MRVAVLFNDDESLAHGEARDAIATQGVREESSAVAAACRQNGWEAVEVAVTRDLRRFVQDLEAVRADVAFFLVEAVGGEARLEAAAAAVLEWLRVPYTGSPPSALTIGLDKPLAKALLASRGVPVPRGAVLESADDPLPELRWPCIVKPAREDASHGISSDSVVADEAAARRRAAWVVATYDQPALVEEFVGGREFNVSILGSGASARVLPPSEIDFSRFPAGRPALVTYEAKWVEDSAEYRATPARFPDDLDPALARRVSEASLAAYRAVGVRDYGRVDLRVDPALGPLVLEVNPNPDVSPTAGLARAAAKAGIPYAALVRGIVEEALARSPSAPTRR